MFLHIVNISNKHYVIHITSPFVTQFWLSDVEGKSNTVYGKVTSCEMHFQYSGSLRATRLLVSAVL
jgi:hypothetical protein